MTTPLNPGSELTIQVAAETRTAWMAALAHSNETGQALQLDLGHVQELDSAGVQLLLSLRHSLALRQQPLHTVAASAAVKDALAVYGLQGLLQQPGTH